MGDKSLNERVYELEQSFKLMPTADYPELVKRIADLEEVYWNIRESVKFLTKEANKKK